MSFLEQLERHYVKKGYTVYSRHSSALPVIPHEWSGPLPDLVADKGIERIAVSVETSGSLVDEMTPSRWRQVINNNAALKLYVRDQAEMDLLVKVLRREQLSVDVAMLERKGSRRRSVARTQSRVGRLAVALVVIAILCSLILWLASYLYSYEPDFYEPRDQEREIEPVP